MKFTYDLTVVIPVHNATETLKETMDSVLNQKVQEDFSFEVLLINDGSVDNSEELCQDYAKGYKYIRYYSHENKGVSYTRNKGLKLAKGKYILFLDSDDLIGESTLLDNFQVFEEYYKDADILAYPIYKFNGKNAVKHPRTYLYKETILCDVEEYPHLNQTSMNIMVKNLVNKVYFNEYMPFAEDTFFNIEMIMKTGKIIISSKGKYLYRTNSYSTVNHFKSPVRTANYLVDSYVELINKSEKNGKISKYIQSVILYELNWRMRFNGLFPRHFKEEDYIVWEAKLQYILGYIEVDVLLSQKNIDKFHKFYFLKKSNSKKVGFEFRENEISYKVEEEEIHTLNKMLLVFSQFKVKDGKLLVSGFIKEPLLELLQNEIELFVLVDGKRERLNLYKSNFGHYKSPEYTNLFLQFNCEVPMKNQNIKFEVKVNHSTIDTKFYFKENTIIKSTYFKENRVHVKNFMINVKGGVIQVKKVDSPIRYFQKALNSSLITKKALKTKYALLIPFKYVQTKNKKKINLYSDRPGLYSESYNMFQHNLKNILDESHYYIYRKTDGINVLKGINQIERSFFIEYGSLKHKTLFLNAQNIYTSSTVFGNYSAFGKKAYNFVAEQLNYDLIWVKGFMNNGVHPKKYAKEVTNVDKVIVRSLKDKENLIQHYNYCKENIQISPQDITGIKKEGEKRILIGFTWRGYLVEKSLKKLEEKRRGKFAKSEYFKNLMAILDSDILSDLISQGYKVDFYLHPKFKAYLDLFNLINFNINVLFSLDSKVKYDVLISDYSSLIDTFEMQGNKVIKYHIDHDEFYCGNHMFKNLIDVEDYHAHLDDVLLDLERLKGEKNE